MKWILALTLGGYFLTQTSYQVEGKLEWNKVCNSDLKVYCLRARKLLGFQRKRSAYADSTRESIERVHVYLSSKEHLIFVRSFLRSIPLCHTASCSRIPFMGGPIEVL